MRRVATIAVVCAAALAPRAAALAPQKTRVRTRRMQDDEILRRADEVGPLVRSFGASRGSRRGGGGTIDAVDAATLRRAAEELVGKRQKFDGSVIVATRAAAPRDLVGFALMNDDTLETLAVAVPERGRGVGASLVDAASEASRRAGNGELLVEVESFNGKGPSRSQNQTAN